MDNAGFLKQVGDKIKEARNEQKITVRELGLLTGLDYGHISRTENGQVDCKLSTLKSIADALNCDLKALL